MVDLVGLLGDLSDEGASLDGLVAGLSDEQWSLPTPAPRWTIAHQIGHLAWTDEQAGYAVSDPAEFARRAQEILSGPVTVDSAAADWAARPPQELLGAWRAGRRRLAGALASVPAGTRLPWYGPPMSPASMVTARLMETWAHGQDVADTLGVSRPPGARLRHIAHLAVRTRDFAFGANGLTPPAEEFRVRLTGPDGDSWAWGPEDAAQSVTGPALDLCLVATQRRRPDDTGLVAVGPDAARWLQLAQAFAGPPGQRRAKG